MKKLLLTSAMVTCSVLASAVPSFTLTTTNPSFFYLEFPWDGFFTTSGNTASFNPGSQLDISRDSVYQSFWCIQGPSDARPVAVKYSQLVSSAPSEITLDLFNSSLFTLRVNYRLIGIAPASGPSKNDAKGYVAMHYSFKNTSFQSGTWKVFHYVEQTPKAPSIDYGAASTINYVNGCFTTSAPDPNASVLTHWAVPQRVTRYRADTYTTLRNLLVGTTGIGTGTVTTFVTSVPGDNASVIECDHNVADGASASGLICMGFNFGPRNLGRVGSGMQRIR